jgi:hypothetical protein
MPNFNKAFWDWFGDSKVVDAKGQPAVVYHGAPDVRHLWKTGFSKSPTRGNTFFATDSKRVAETYADSRRAWDYQNAEEGVISIYLSIRNPMFMDAEGKPWRDTEKYVKQARDGGHDGLIIFNSIDDYQRSRHSKPSTVYVFFDPKQAKSAHDAPMLSRTDRKPIAGSGPNLGTWDRNDPVLTNPGSNVLVVRASEPDRYDVFVNRAYMGQVKTASNGTALIPEGIAKRHHLEIKQQIARIK